METLATIFPILAVCALGYFSAKKNFISELDSESLSKFVFTFLIPPLLFMGTAKASMPEGMVWEYLFAYFLAVLFVYILGVCIAKYALNYNEQEQSVFGMGSSYSNVTIVGIPLCVFILGEQALLPLFIIISVHNLALFTLGILIAERRTLSLTSFFKSLFTIIKQLLMSPITGALILGGLVNVLNISLYKPVEATIDLMASAAIPAALFVLGASLNSYKIHGSLTPAFIIVLLKMMIFPLVIWLFMFNFFSIDLLWAKTALLASSMPIGISVYIFSQKYQACEAPIATSIIISTLCSVLTLTLISAYY